MNISRFYFLTILVLIGFTLIGCGASDMEVVATVEDGTSRIEILAQDGVLTNGDNNIQVRLITDGQIAAIDEVALAFYMPAMGTMPRMDSPAQFAAGDFADEKNGTVKFGMNGGWNGQIQLQGENGQVGGTLKVQVGN